MGTFLGLGVRVLPYCIVACRRPKAEIVAPSRYRLGGRPGENNDWVQEVPCQWGRFLADRLPYLSFSEEKCREKIKEAMKNYLR